MISIKHFAIIFISISLLLAGDSRAEDQPALYDFQSVRYSNLAAAEAAMRSAYGERGRELKLCDMQEGYPSGANGGGTFIYCFNDVALLPPYAVRYHASWLPDHFDYTGFGCNRLGYPYYDPGECFSEDEMVQWVSNSSYFKCLGCTTVATFSGEYAQVGDWKAYDVGYALNIFYEMRTLELKTFSADGKYMMANYFDARRQDYHVCPPDYSPKNNKKWPNVCESQERVYIFKLDHINASSCPRTGFPCVPATGDKLISEFDFEWEGHVFSRTYHSIQELPTFSVMGRGWSHAWSQKLVPNPMARISELNEYEGYKPTNSDNSLYRSENGGNEIRVINPFRFKVELKNGDVQYYEKDEVYGKYAKLVRVELSSRFSKSLNFTYDRQNRISLVATDSGRSLKFVYDDGAYEGDDLDAGRLIRVVDDLGLAMVNYKYDSSLRLVEVSYPGGGSRRYHYGEEDNLCVGAIGCDSNVFLNYITGVSDESSARLSNYYYDNSGRVVRSVYALGANDTRLSYNSNGETVVERMGAGKEAYRFDAGLYRRPVLKFDLINGLEAGSEEWQYDVGGLWSRHIDKKGVSTKVELNDRGLEVQRAEGEYQGGNANLPEKRTTQTDWHADFKRPTERRIRDAADTLIAKSSWTYNARGQALISTEIDLASNVARAVTSTYCEGADVAAGACPVVGLTISLDGPFSGTTDTTRYTYYPADDVSCASSSAICWHRKGDLWKVTNAQGQVIEYLAYDGAGRVLSVKDANGIITDYTYHPRGWLTASKVRGAEDASENDDRITLIDYWPTGLVKQVTQPDGAFTTFTYDAAHRLTDIADNAGNTLHYTLDNAGNWVKEDTKDASGALKRTLSRVYNQLGQLATQATAKGDPTDFTYDPNGNTKTVTDALGHLTQNDYDPLNRLARTLQDVGGIAAETQFAYDALDNLTKVTDPKGLETSYEYNGFGDLTKLTSPDTGTTSYTYDSAGNRASQTDARGITTTYSYDALNRLTKVAYPTTGFNVTYTYDISQSVCASGETFAIGRLAKMQDGGAITQYCYDRFGDLVRKVQTTNGHALVLRYAYTKAGQLSRLSYPDGAVVDYVRNAQGQATEVGVTPPGGARQVLLGNATYYPFGPVAGWTYGNGRPMQRVLDQDYRPLAISDTRSDGLGVGFAFDPAGNLSALTAPGNPAPVVGLRYDALGRLTEFKDGPTGAVIDGYSYDATGNRLSAKVNGATQAYAYPDTSHRLSAVAGTARTYDAVGNTTAIGGTARQYVYDATGRMSQAKRAGQLAMNYRYNGRGEQVRRFLGTANTYTLYDEAGHWLGDYDNNGAPLQQAIWLDDLPVGVLASGNQLRYVQPDHLGTPRTVIDPVRDVAIWKWDLKGEAFGSTPPDQDPDADGTAFVFDMRFPGQRYDTASGLNQNYFRDYDASTGRYGQSDPIGLNGDISSYSYSLSSPLTFQDILGLQASRIRIPNGSTYVSPAYGNAGRQNPDGTYSDYPGVSWPTSSEILASLLSSGVDIYNLPIFGSNKQEARGKNDPIVLPPVNPGRDCDGNCNPCPPGVRWFVDRPGHGHSSGYWHVIRYNQDPKTCMCHPDRPSAGLSGL